MIRIMSCCLALVLASSGCATIFTGDRQQVTVSSASAGSQVMVDGQPYGQTPTQLSLDKSQNHTVVVTSADGRSFTCAVNSTVGVGWVVLDIIMGLVPVIVDAATGKWKSLDSGACHSPM